ncbi:MAG: SH3 domain-containing protein [Candidatus Omnitrophota bacterium]
MGRRWGRVTAWIFSSLFILLFPGVNARSGSCAPAEDELIPHTKREMLSVDFWLRKTRGCNRVIMTPEQIGQFNREIIQKVDAVCDLKGYPESLSKEELTDFIGRYKIPVSIRYDTSGKIAQPELYEALKANVNLEGIGAQNPVKYGIAMRRTLLRSFPADTAIYSSPESEFDRFQETACFAFEPALILHQSKDGDWYFVQIYNYRGWVKAGDIALTDREVWLAYLGRPDFLVATGNRVRTQGNYYDQDISRLEFDMGTKIPLAETIPSHVNNQAVIGNYVVKIPCRDAQGQLLFKTALLAETEDVHKGYLPYTRGNVIRQAFKLLGERYDWGDKFGGKDCSSFILSVYHAFGFNLPRNTAEQRISAGKIHNLDESAPLSKRNALLNQVKPGALLYTDGHAMLYLGKVKGVHYVLHNFTNYSRQEGNEWKPYPVYEVMVTSTLLAAESERTFLEKVTTIIELK